MSYVNKNLLPGEKVIYRGKLHWSYFITPLSWIVLALLITIFLYANRDSSWASILCLPAGVLAFGGVLGFLASALAADQTEFAITNRRIIAKSGVIRRHSLELMLGKVESVRVIQPLFGMIFDYGTVIVSGTGGTHETFRYLAHPEELRRQVQTLIQPPS
jgi:uncharacterized membrane protein YdbT with pleckstrin-like domain